MLTRVFSTIDYLAFMVRWSGGTRYDLASSGIASVDADALGAIAPQDFSSRDRYGAAIAARYAVPTSEVLPCLGTSGALFAACASVCSPAGRAQVLVETPGYEPLSRIAEALGLEVTRFARRPERGYAIEPGAVLERVTPATRLVIVTNPHNPTAVIADDALIAELGAQLAARDVWLLVDEVYGEAIAPGRTARRLGSHVLACSSVTKCWGVPWARAGWLLAPAALCEMGARVERCTMNSAPPASWAYGARAFERSEQLAARARDLQAGKRALIDAFVSAHPELSWSAPHAATPFGWLRDRRGRDLSTALEAAVAEQGLLVAPGSYFGDPSAFRLGWTSPLETLREGLPVLERVLQRALT